MAFNVERFKTSKFRHRTENVLVSEIKEFFDEDQKAEFTVRGLDAIEYGRVLDAVNQYKGGDIVALVQSVSGGDPESISAGIKDYAERSKEKIPDDIIRRSYLIEYGCVEPALDMAVVKKIRKYHTEVFYKLSEKIKTLTAMGSEPGE